jgi:hypothetical protein
MTQIQRALALVVMLSFVTSCATMVRGTTEEVLFNTTPRGAKATLSNGTTCVTPCSITLKRNESISVTFARDGCDSHMASVFPVLAGAGVILGGLIDYGTGAVYNLQPNPVVAALKCSQPAEPPVTVVEHTDSKESR